MKKIIGKIFYYIVKNLSKLTSKCFISVYFYKFNLALFQMAIHGLGILNYKSFTESGEANFINSYLNSTGDSPTILDIGACSGSYALYCKKIKPQAKVYAFEPHPSTFKGLKTNTENTDIEVYNFGLGNKNEETVIYDSIKSNGSQHASIYKEVLDDLHKYDDTGATNIQLRILDDFIAEKDINNIDLLKIDTEGNEWAVLQGTLKSLSASKIKCIHIEFNEMNVISKVFLRDFIKLLPDFDFYRLLPDGMIKINYNPLQHELFAFQNIVAVRKDINIKDLITIV